jgi:dihydropteroate synthase
MSGARAAQDPVFGDVALALAARASAARRMYRASCEWLDVEFDPRALGADDRARLDSVCGQHAPIDRGAERSGATEFAVGTPRRERIACPRAALAGLEARTEVLDALLLAHDNAHREHEPVRLMGIVNVTPDSFSASSRFPDPAQAIQHGLELVAEGADILDIGGESSRPGCSPIRAELELERVLPVIRGLAECADVAISVDTMKAVVADAALDAGATIVNDVSAGRSDARMLPVVAEHRAGFVAMHMQGTPRDMQARPNYADVVTEVAEFLRSRVRACLESCIDRSRIWIDPGIGFGKELDHNLEILARLDELRSLGLPICLGVSRKSFIAAVERGTGEGGESDPEQRIGGTAAASAIGVWKGASILRVHDVRVMAQAARLAEALARWKSSEPRADSCSRGDGAHNHRR